MGSGGSKVPAHLPATTLDREISTDGRDVVVFVSGTGFQCLEGLGVSLSQPGLSFRALLGVRRRDTAYTGLRLNKK